MRRLLLVAMGAGVVATLMPSSAPAGVNFGTIEEHPEVTHDKWKRKAEDDYKQGMEARAAGKKADAVKFLMRAFDIGRRMRIQSPYPQKAADALKLLSDEGMRELAVARDLAGGEAPDAGLVELKRIARTYLGLPPAKLAGTYLRQLEKDPRFQASLRAVGLADQLARAEALEAQAAALAPKPDPAPDPAPEAGPDAAEPPHPPTKPPLPKGVDAADIGQRPLTGPERAARRLDLLAEVHAIYVRVAEAGKGTEVGTRARAARARLEQDAPLMARIRQVRAEGRAQEWLGLGTNYMRAGRMDKARAFFEKILAECPNTPQAREAKGYLDGMTK